MNPFASVADAVLFLALLVTLGHIALCALYPYKACRRCDGTGKIFGPFGGIRLCGLCGATGLQLRLGRRVWNRVRRLYRDIKELPRPLNLRPLQTKNEEHLMETVYCGPNDSQIHAVLSSNELRTAWAADELMAVDFPEPQWAVPGILAEGVSLLAGPPKVGKSWLSLGLGLTVAAGGKAFGRVDVQGGPVLYLALEDTPRRLKARMSKILNGQPAPTDLRLATSCPPLAQGGDEAIAAWLNGNAGARLVVIDVFAKVRGTQAGMSAYDADYAAVGRAKSLADKYGVAVVLVHHVRKASANDFLAEVSGTNGLAGAADATLVLKRARGQADGVLHVTGRDVDEAEYALSFEPSSGSWLMLDGPADEHTLTDTRAAIVRQVRKRPGSTPAQLAAAINAARENVKRTCARMAEVGQLRNDGTGRYYPPDQPDNRSPEFNPRSPQ